jgi:hypothetical protein
MPKPSNMVMSQKLPDVPGKTLTALLVQYEPGGKTPKHHHLGSVMALSFQARSDRRTPPPDLRASTTRAKPSTSRPAASIS